ncbi:cinnamoyl-CoA reductase-like SNL6 isoform X1 [Dendrobium catenatum]|uniref:cinnamoyl-CoA reductase-like SNL6 isoform X1 n=1 Tax=Dendrobium catenatum TaxID=906689 RepID=UPI0009F3B37D|nr:cinnamoyl-CoA reductase-like SNL6 isoform X1 [Dendrobium catenatum]
MAPAAIARHTTKTVCVMDSSNRLGVALVDRLLHRGYTVHAAAFARGDATKAAWSENKRVRVFRADPLDYNSIAEAIRGCSGLFYTFDDESSYDEFMVEIELRAAHNVLEACAQADTIERVVFTSSVTALIWNEKLKVTEDVDERDWSDPNFCRKFKLWHALAKTLSEKTAWALAMDRGVDMVAVNAGLILAGPELSSANPYLKGAPEMYEDGVLVTVKLKFLVDAHICVFENPDAYGRYLCFNHTICHPKDAINLAQMLSPGPSPPPRYNDGLGVIQGRIHSKKLNKLLLEYRDGLQVAE